jgi:hypothetical protein
MKTFIIIIFFIYLILHDNLIITSNGLKINKNIDSIVSISEYMFSSNTMW